MVERAAAGDALAFETLVRGSMDGLYRVARRFMGSDHDAEDMVQEAYFKGYKSLPRFRGDSRFRTWMTRILINVCKDHLAKRWSVRVPEPIEAAAQVPSRAETPDQGAARAELRGRIDWALQRLPADERQVAVLALVEQLPYSEISRAVGSSEGTVAWRLFEARKKLRGYLKEWREE